MEKFFNIFGKVALVIIVLGALTYTGYVFGKKQTSVSDDTKVKYESNSTPVAIVQPSPTPVSLTTIIGGVSKSAGLSFDQYSVVIPDGWTSKKENQTLNDEKLSLERNGYQINIFQGATGGALCLYPGDADFEGPSSKFQVFTTLTTKDGRTMRRSGDKDGMAFTVCQKSTDGSYQQPTNYGHISIKLPVTWDSEGLKVVDSILSSLKKI